MAIALVFSVIGTDKGIYGNLNGQRAMGAGFLVLSLVNVSIIIVIRRGTNLTLLTNIYIVISFRFCGWCYFQVMNHRILHLF